MEPDKKGRELVEEEKKEMRMGQEVYEMTQTAGWKHIEKMLEDRAFHSWVDPRETETEKEWMWRELNLFHSADTAKQLIEDIRAMIGKAEYLADVESGKIIEGQKMKI